MKVWDKEFVPFINREKVQHRIQELGKAITDDYQGKNPIFVGVLNGAFVFTADLVRAVDLQVEVSFTKYSSYRYTQSTGKVVELIGFDKDVEGKDVIIVEDIVDTGLTMAKLVEEVAKFNPNSIKLASLLLKPDALKTDVHVDYLGFDQ